MRLKNPGLDGVVAVNGNLSLEIVNNIALEILCIADGMTASTESNEANCDSY